MQYEMGMLMWDWVTKVEDLAQRLDDIHFPMIPIDIINTLTRNLPDPYSPFIVLVNSLLNDLNYSANSSTVQEVIKRLLNEEACQTKATYVDFPLAHIARDCRKPVTCYIVESPVTLGLIVSSAPKKSECAKSKDHAGRNGVMMRQGSL